MPSSITPTLIKRASSANMQSQVQKKGFFKWLNLLEKGKLLYYWTSTKKF